MSKTFLPILRTFFFGGGGGGLLFEVKGRYVQIYFKHGKSDCVRNTVNTAGRFCVCNTVNIVRQTLCMQYCKYGKADSVYVIL